MYSKDEMMLCAMFICMCVLVHKHLYRYINISIYLLTIMYMLQYMIIGGRVVEDWVDYTYIHVYTHNIYNLYY